MDQSESIDDTSVPPPSESTNDSSLPLPSSNSNSYHQSRQRTDLELKDATRKVQKADREKLRRDKLNDIFIELGNTLDPDRPKNDKATIITDTIQTLRDLTAEVNKLKAECATLSDETRELTQEKNELRDEKASLKSEIDNLNIQCQQRHSVMYPWGAIDPAVVMAPPPPYSFPVALPMPPRPIPIRPSLQPFHFYGNHNPVAIPTPHPTFMTHYPHFDQASTENESTSSISKNQEHPRNSIDACTAKRDWKDGDSHDVVTVLELKIPGSTAQQELSAGDRKGKRPQRNEKIMIHGSLSTSRQSSQDFTESSSNNVHNIDR